MDGASWRIRLHDPRAAAAMRPRVTLLRPLVALVRVAVTPAAGRALQSFYVYGYNHRGSTGVTPAVKPEATAIGDPQDGRWKITLTFDGRRFCIPKFKYSTLHQTTRQ